jgi:hypothetical protein
MITLTSCLTTLAGQWCDTSLAFACTQATLHVTKQMLLAHSRGQCSCVHFHVCICCEVVMYGDVVTGYHD